MDSSVKPSKESFVALLDLLADNYEVDKLLQALVLYDDNTVEPSEKCNKLFVKHSKDNLEKVSQCVESVSQMQQPQLDIEVSVHSSIISLQNPFDHFSCHSNLPIFMLAILVLMILLILLQTWNTLLSNCYSETFNLSIKAQQIQNLMKKFNIPFLPQVNSFLL